MKVLLTADLHDRRQWLEWLVAQAPQYELVCIAGDLLDMFSADEQGQVDYLRSEWLPAMIATGTPVVISSGNHDHYADAWLTYISNLDNCVGDGATRLLALRSGEPLIVTTCPNGRWDSDALMVRLWEEGARLHRETYAPWLVLHHEPPAQRAPRGCTVTHWLTRRLETYRPTYVLCGHLHEWQEFASRLRGVWIFNAGQRLDAPRPNHLILETGENTITRVRMAPLGGTLSWAEDRVWDYLKI